MPQATDKQTETEPQTVPAKGKAAKPKKKPAPPKPKRAVDDFRTEKYPYEVGEPDPKVKVPSEDAMKAMGKTALRKIAAGVSGLNYLATGWLTPKELKFMIRNDYPFESSGLNVDGFKVRSPQDAYKLAGERKKAWGPIEAARIKEREQLRADTFGGDIPGVERGSDEFIRRVIGDKVLVPVTGIKQRATERFYDVDGRAGRKEFYEFVAKEDLRQDGKPRKGAYVYRISPQVIDRILSDSDLKDVLEVPEGFNKPEPKEKKPKAEKKSTGKGTGRKRRSVKDALADPEDQPSARPEPTEEQVEEQVEEPASEEESTPEELPIPEL